MGCVLVIDTSYGSTVGVTGHEPIVETDSRTHVERLQVNIARAVKDAGYTPQDIDTVIVGTGPAPFTGLRAGIVAAKALAFATGAELIGHDVLTPQAQWNLIRRSKSGTLGDPKTSHVLTLAVNDARRKQLYFALYAGLTASDDVTDTTDVTGTVARTLIDMDIDYPASIADRVNAAVREYATTVEGEIVIDVVGHGATKYADALRGIEHLGDMTDESVLDQGRQGLDIFAADATIAHAHDPQAPVEPLYLRRPDAEVPAPLKHVLGHEGAGRKD
ncbi:tRNA (adenosine(37)-N6)-threonylcarbamoyltransferase complex dimerization subunit type 1 TsaB [Bifidobacterium saguinibicoloris]|uniref:tRNA (adenosine(37)-N6)-threonylcarbamoyltransferase complex dimerization subunit type 1 TsaB n=1 Tax=Bifidobacterium saguinibicoloris TaxID=2834433 RepID=UPI001C5696F2|nr:tRNA (adenosine(37)-N6)-threonylcarbamoyltransferase complex dimerization subunit type 1 TsaB [Bifidobacterium saguinibicoloris]MBW3079831.1 tRNA (adenosine(37)-N6)-threonylcarbamoyltransferase complex dimerization subunit type 1 TsaB [Bifidobacterium saguinibicoloris]